MRGGRLLFASPVALAHALTRDAKDMTSLARRSRPSTRLGARLRRSRGGRSASYGFFGSTTLRR
jgi:hypothetical protein